MRAMPHFHTAPNAVSVVVGASRGLGLALSAALLQRSTGRVVALARQPEEAPALMWRAVAAFFCIFEREVVFLATGSASRVRLVCA